MIIKQLFFLNFLNGNYFSFIINIRLIFFKVDFMNWINKLHNCILFYIICFKYKEGNYLSFFKPYIK
jgi:hypothetical protein